MARTLPLVSFSIRSDLEKFGDPPALAPTFDLDSVSRKITVEFLLGGRDFEKEADDRFLALTAAREAEFAKALKEDRPGHLTAYLQKTPEEHRAEKANTEEAKKEAAIRLLGELKKSLYSNETPPNDSSWGTQPSPPAAPTAVASSSEEIHPSPNPLNPPPLLFPPGRKTEARARVEHSIKAIRERLPGKAMLREVFSNNFEEEMEVLEIN